MLSTTCWCSDRDLRPPYGVDLRQPVGRILAATVPECRAQIYVDDPLFSIPGEGDDAAHLLSLTLLCTRIFGFPLKLSKASAGQTVRWIGAEIQAGEDEEGRFVQVTIPEEKTEKLLAEVDRMLKAPVVGTKQLRSFAGGMAFVAGLVPEDEGWEIITDACLWGIGGILYHNGMPKRWFSSPLSPELLEKFKAQKGDPAFNTAWEALALLVALRLWLPRCPKFLAVRIKSDNVGALRMLLKLTSQSGALATIAREVALDVAGGNYSIGELEHVPGITNVAADALSRLFAPHPPPFPFLGAAVKDQCPSLDDSFWKIV
eukprot:s2504_g5.t1